MKQSRILILYLCFLSVILTLFSCRSDTPYNVVLISIDTLRPDHLGCYGYDRQTSPTIDRLAREGVRFENAFSSTTWTLPAHLAMLTSLPDIVHNVQTEASTLDQSRITLAEIMKAHNYHTTGIFTGPFMMPVFGLNHGFDDYLDKTLYDKSLDGAEIFNEAEKGETTSGAMDEVETLLDQSKNEPFFLFLHLFDVHADFDPPAPYDTMFDPNYEGEVTGIDVMNNPAINKDMPPKDFNHLLSLYDGEIRFVDEAGIARLVDMLTERGLIDKTLIILTSDHGEEFFEHGVIGHRQNLYDTTLRIPLIFWGPKLLPAGKVVKEQVRIIDIMPTILDLLGLPQSPEGLGKSVQPLFNGQKEDKDRTVFASLKDWKVYMESLRTEKYKIIRDYIRNEPFYIDLLNDSEELYPILDQDQEELNNIEEQFRIIRLNLLSFTKSLPWKGVVAPKLDPELIQRLKSLGYLNKK
jgi:arylsulfatase A-like enzyme